MKILKKILFGIAILVAIVLITALFIKKDYAVEKEVVINKPRAEVFDYIKHLKNQDLYSTFTMKDPGMEKSFKGKDATVGFIYAWNGNSDAGKGEQEIKDITEGQRMDMELRFIKPIEGKADAYMTTEALGENQTKVKWGFKSRMPYPFNAMRLFISVENMMGKELSASLANLKVNLEK
jgi:uncharacterized protein YndB with AHSA1/START domain